MTHHSDKEKHLFQGESLTDKDTGKIGGSRLRPLLTNIKTLVPMLGGVLLIFCGLTLVSITILGLITPLLISAFLSLLGSISTMVGFFLIYQTITASRSFDSLIHEAIRRVLNSQN